MSISRRAALVLALGFLPIVPVALSAAPDGPAGATRNAPTTQLLELPPAALTGKVTYPDGQAVPAGAVVRVWSTDKACFVLETRVGERGTYRLPALDPGAYQIVFADRVRVPAVVAEERGDRPTVFHVVIPHGVAAFAHMPIEQKAVVLSALGAVPGDEDDDDDDSGLLPVVLIGGGALTGVAILADSQDWFEEGHRRHVVSP